MVQEEGEREEEQSPEECYMLNFHLQTGLSQKHRPILKIWPVNTTTKKYTFKIMAAVTLIFS